MYIVQHLKVHSDFDKRTKDLNLIYLDDEEIPIESKKWANDTIESYRVRIDQSNPRIG